MEQNQTTARKIHCVIRGIKPLLMHNPANMGSDGKRDLPPADFAKEALYVTEDGEIYQPASHIEKALEQAGKQIKDEGRSKYNTKIKTFVTVEPTMIPHKHQKWEPFTTSVVLMNPRKVRIVRHRPMFKKWELEFDILVENPNVSLAKLEEALTIAGMYGGIGDYRPKFGRFEVVKFAPAE